MKSNALSKIRCLLRKTASGSVAASAVLAVGVAGGLVSSVAAGEAEAAPAASTQNSPGTFGGDFELPQRWNEDFQPGSRCTPPGTVGTYVSAKRHWFKQTDAASVANHNSKPVPVTQQIKETRTQTTEISAKVKPVGELERYVATAFGLDYVHLVQWSLTQKVGPYTLPANRQGKLVWGFSMLDIDAQDVRCGEDLKWHPVGSSYQATIPEARYSELRLDDAEDWD